MHNSRTDRPISGHVTEDNLRTVDDSRLHHIEVRRGRPITSGATPGRVVMHDGARRGFGSVAHRLGQRP